MLSRTGPRKLDEMRDSPFPPRILVTLPGSAADMHPRALRLTEDLVGHLIKFKLKPARADGDVGHMESSRPTPEVAAASADAVAAARSMAAAKRRAAAAARVAGGSVSPFSS